MNTTLLRGAPAPHSLGATATWTRGLLRSVLGVACLTAVTFASAQSRVFAPYVDMGLSNNNLPQLSKSSGTKMFTMAFITSNGTCQASWFGITSISADTTFKPMIDSLRGAGGDVIISFGGATGTELAAACTSATGVQSQYQAVINKYGVKRLDFDIEGAAIADTASNNRRNQALAALQRANTGLIISYTLPVLTTGLTQDGINLLANAKSNGVNISIVNVMTMDYGGSANPNTMGQNAIDAANATLAQMRTIGLSCKLGVTPMIGLNDTSPEVFTLSDAAKLVNWAKGNSNVGLLAFWSVARDTACPGGGTFVSASCSGISQSTWAFSHAFLSFSGGGTTTPDFSIDTSPASASVTPGSSVSFTTTVGPFGSFNSSVALSASGLPTGASATFNPTSISGGAGNSTLKISTSSSTPAGTYTITVKGASGSLSHTSTVSLTVSGSATQVAAPTFSPAGGSYSSAQSVTLSSATSGASIRYTTDGSTPSSTSGTSYSGAFTVSKTTTVKAIAFKSGLTNSSVSTATYTISTSGGGNAWAPNTPYAVGAIVTYQGHTYKCLQAHTSEVGWEPATTPALWQLQS